VGVIRGDFSCLEKTYVDALCAEIDMYARELPWRGSRCQSIFFGGGTPSLFSASSIDRLIQHAAKYFQFSRDIEITLEANPGTLKEDLGDSKLRELRSAGVNRLSIGVQSFRQEKLAFLGRAHSGADAVSSIHKAREAGFTNVSMDLMFGVGSELLEDWLGDLQQAVSLSPEHISAYGLTIESGTDFGLRAARGEQLTISDSEFAELYIEGRRFLGDCGYLQYEVSNYALSGRECRHNLGYWRQSCYLGIGAGAHSYYTHHNSKFRLSENILGPSLKVTQSPILAILQYCCGLAQSQLPNMTPICFQRKRNSELRWVYSAEKINSGLEVQRWWNVPGPKLYVERCLTGVSPISSQETLLPWQQELEFISLRLRLAEGFSTAEYESAFGVNIEDRFGETLKRLRADGLLEEDSSFSSQIKVSPRGLLLLNSVIEEFA